MLCEVHIFIEISISVHNLFSRTAYNGIWSGALKLYNYPHTHFNWLTGQFADSEFLERITTLYFYFKLNPDTNPNPVEY